MNPKRRLWQSLAARIARKSAALLPWHPVGCAPRVVRIAADAAEPASAAAGASGASSAALCAAAYSGAASSLSGGEPPPLEIDVVSIDEEEAAPVNMRTRAPLSPTALTRMLEKGPAGGEITADETLDSSHGGDLASALHEEEDDESPPAGGEIQTPYGMVSPGFALRQLLGTRSWSQGGTNAGRLDRVRRSGDAVLASVSGGSSSSRGAEDEAVVGIGEPVALLVRVRGSPARGDDVLPTSLFTVAAGVSFIEAITRIEGKAHTSFTSLSAASLADQNTFVYLRHAQLRV